MANILLKTEALDDTSEWTQSDFLTVTANVAAAPADYGINAGMADRLVDANITNACGLDGGYKNFTSDGSDWTLSVHLVKDAVTTRFPVLFLHFENGTPIRAGISLNTAAGTVTTSGIVLHTAPDASGVVDMGTYWRFWLRVANNNTGNNAARARFQPAATSTHGGASDPSAQGTVDAFGFNLTNTTTVQPYEPDPFYAFVTAEVPAKIIFQHA